MPAREGEILVALPIGGRLDILGLHPRPAVAEPERGGVVAAIGDEFLPFAVADRAAGERVRRQQHLMARSEEHTSELQSLMRISYAVFCLKKTKIKNNNTKTTVH